MYSIHFLKLFEITRNEFQAYIVLKLRMWKCNNSFQLTKIRGLIKAFETSVIWLPSSNTALRSNEKFKLGLNVIFLRKVPLIVQIYFGVLVVTTKPMFRDGADNQILAKIDRLFWFFRKVFMNVYSWIVNTNAVIRETKTIYLIYSIQLINEIFFTFHLYFICNVSCVVHYVSLWSL